MNGKTFLERLGAIEAQTLTEVELHSKLIWLIIGYLMEYEDLPGWVQSPATSDSITSSPDSHS